MAEIGEELIHACGIVADEHHVASRSERRLDTFHDSTCAACSFHRQIIAENDAIELELAAQRLFQPDRRVTGRPRVYPGIYHVRGHDGREARSDHAPERHKILTRDFLVAPLVDGYFS